LSLSFNVDSSGVDDSVFLFSFRDQNRNGDILINRNFVGDRNVNVIVDVVRNSVSNLVAYSSSSSSVLWSIVSNRSISVNRFSLLELNIGGNVVLGRILDFLGVDSSSRNGVVHGSVDLTVLYRKSHNFFRVSYSRGVDERKSGLFGVVNRLNVILSVDGASRNGNLSNTAVSLVSGRLYLRFESSSDFRRVHQLNGLSVICNGRLNVSIVLGNRSSNLHISRFGSSSTGNRLGDSVSVLNSSSLTVKTSLSIFSEIQNGVLVIYNLSDWSSESFGEDLRFSSNSSN